LNGFSGNGAPSLYGSSVRGTWRGRGGSFARGHEGYVKEGSGSGHLP